jgi:FHA domain
MERHRIALIDLLGPDGQVLRSVDVAAWPVSVGRALDQHVVVDDPFVAPNHLTLRCDEGGQWVLDVGDTINGVQLAAPAPGANPTGLLAGQQVRLDTPDAQSALVFKIGHTTLRVRRLGQPLAPEQRLPPSAPAPGKAAPTTAQPRSRAPVSVGMLAALLMAAVALQQGLRLDPGADFTTAWLPVLTGLPTLLMLWCGAWALMSKVFQQRLDFMAHLRVVVPAMLMLTLLQTLLPVLAAGLGWPWLWRCLAPLRVVVVAYTVFRHLALIAPPQRRRAALAVAMATLAGSGFNLALSYRSTQRLSAPPYMSSLPLPGLNATRAAPSADLVAELLPLSHTLSRTAAQNKAEDLAETDDD